jgi:flagellar basal body P-ring formation protein FlgA
MLRKLPPWPSDRLRIMYIMLNNAPRMLKGPIGEVEVGFRGVACQWLIALLVSALPAFPTWAAPFPHAELQRQAELFVINQLRDSGQDVTAKADPVDSRTQLPGCAELEGFLSPGARLWGKTHVGLRCVAPHSWTIYVPVDIRIVGNAVYPLRVIRRGQVIAPTDVGLRSTVLTQHSPDVVLRLADVAGKTAQLDLAPGNPIRQPWLSDTLMVKQGKRVRMISKGAGFSVSMEGIALEHGAAGRVVRIKAASGRIVQGIVRGPGLVEVTY